MAKKKFPEFPKQVFVWRVKETNEEEYLLVSEDIEGIGDDVEFVGLYTLDSPGQVTRNVVINYSKKANPVDIRITK